MAKIVEVQLVAKTDDAVAGVNKVDEAVKKTASTTKKASKELSGMQQAGGAVLGKLDQMTGGLASKLVSVGKAAKLSGKAMKTALITSGIGAAVVAIGLIVQYWDEISSLVNGVSSEQEKQLQNTQDVLAAQQEQLSVTGQMENSLKLQGKTDKEIRDIKKQQTDEIIASTELLLEQQKQQKKAQVEAAERNQNITKGIIAFLSAPLTVLLGVVDGITNTMARLGILDEGTSLTEDFLNFSSSLLFDPEEVAEEGEATVKATEDALRKLKNTRDGYLLQEQAEKDKAKDKDKKTDKVEVDPEVAAKAKALEEIAKLEDAYIQSQLDKKVAEENLVSDKYFNLIEQAKLYGEDIALLEEAQAQELADIQDKYDAIEKEKKDKKLEDDKKIAQAKADLQNKLTGEVANAVGAIGNIFEKGTAASKGAALAEIAIGTGMGFINALDIAQKSAKGTGPAAAFAFPIFYASQIAAVLGAVSQAKNILSTVKGGGGSGNTPTAPTGGGSAPQPPAFNIVGASGETQLADAIGSQTQRPARAYVVSNDVTTAQEMDRNIIEGASIG
jgi:hypothetical protein